MTRLSAVRCRYVNIVKNCLENDKKNLFGRSCIFKIYVSLSELRYTLLQLYIEGK